MSAHPDSRIQPRYPLLALMSPRLQTRVLLGLTIVVLVTWGLLTWKAGMPVWGATTLLLAVSAIPAVRRWNQVLRMEGATVMLLSVILTLQTFHTIEHVVQWVQFHLLAWRPERSSGLISAANAEWVHFVWNWGIVGVVFCLFARGVRNRWAWVLLAWSLAHAGEHTYMMARYLQLKQELGLLGVPEVSAQGLPGILGRDGLLATRGIMVGSFCGRVPGLTTISRIDVHFWWNLGETVLLAAAAHSYLRHNWTSNGDVR